MRSRRNVATSGRTEQLVRIFMKNRSLILLAIILQLLLLGCSDDSQKDEENTDEPEDTGPDPEVVVEETVDELLEGLTLDQKIAQMVQARYQRVSLTDLSETCYGSVFVGGGEELVPNTPENWAKTIDTLQQAVVDNCGIPLLFGIDAVHGNAKVTGSTVFPHGIGLGAAGDEDLAQRVGRAVGIETRAAGIHWTFAPAVSVARDERWGRTYEGYAETPELNATLGAAMIRGMQGDDDLSDVGSIAATAKHYVGDGGNEDGINPGVNNFGEETMRAIHLPPYEAAVEAKVAAVMPSYHQWNRDGESIYMSIDKYTITDILRDELGFDGFVISDWDAIARVDGIETYEAENVTAAVEAGIDMAMIPEQGTGDGEDMETFMKHVEENISEEMIDEAVRRILRIKVRMDLFADDFKKAFSDESLLDQVYSEAHQALAREAVQKSLVLLKNDNDALPLKDSDDIVLAGPWADKMGAQAGGWTAGLGDGDGWQGNANSTTGQIVGETIRDAFEATNDNVTWDEDGEAFDRGDKAVVVIGEMPYAEGVGDHGADLSDWWAPNDIGPFASVYLADQPNYEILTNAIDSGVQVVLVIISGRPLIIEEAINDSVDAIVAAWLPGSRGQGVVDVLNDNDINFTGKLPHTWPATFEQIPINVNKQDDEPGLDADDATPLYPFGHGLSY